MVHFFCSWQLNVRSNSQKLLEGTVKTVNKVSIKLAKHPHQDGLSHHNP